jgi:peroxiredoxin Q/BCP
MTAKTPAKPSAKAPAAAQRQAAEQRARRVRLIRLTVGLVLLAALGGGLFAAFRSGSTAGGAAKSYQVGSPGIGANAPDFALASSAGGTLRLSSLRGKTVLLYFQEGLTCQPCWDQMAGLEKAAGQVKAAGIDEVVSITTDPADLIAQKTRDMALATPVLSDPGLAVSKVYNANSYGMMGDSRDGHTFVLVGPDGVIRWRADYGGAPKYTMFVPVDALLADLRAGAKP